MIRLPSPGCWRRLLLRCLLSLALIPAPVWASLQVLSDMPSAGVVAGDRIAGLRVRAADGRLSLLRVHDPIEMDVQSVRCAMQRGCRVVLMRAESQLDVALWVDEVVLIPEVDADDLALLRQALPEVKRSANEERLLELATRWGRVGKVREAAWLTARVAVGKSTGSSVDAGPLAEQSLAWLKADDRDARTQLQLTLIKAQMTAGQFDVAAQALDQLLAGTLPDALRILAARMRGGIFFVQSRFVEAEQTLRSILPIARRLAPASHALAMNLNSLAVVVRLQGRLDDARPLYLQAREAERAFEPGSITEAKITANLGLLERARGDLPRAETLLRDAVAMFQALSAQADLLFDNQTNLALVLYDRGRIREAAALWSQEIPTTTDEAGLRRAARAQTNLALIYFQQGNLDEALRRSNLAVSRWQQAAPEGLDLANTLHDLGLSAIAAGRYAEADAALARAAKLYRGIAPEGAGALNVLDARAELALSEGRALLALSLQDQSLSLRGRGALAESRRDIALWRRGRILLQLNRLDEALVALDESVSESTRMGSENSLAGALATKGDVLLRMGRLAEAKAAACAGVDRVEVMRGASPVGAELRGSFARVASPVYRACMDAYIANGDQKAALDLYQRERGQMLSALIAARDLRFADLPPELSIRRSAALIELETLATSLESETKQAARDELLQQRDRIRARLRGIDDAASAALPRLAAWRGQAAKVPDRSRPGEIVLAYSVRETNTLRISLWSDRPPRLELLNIGKADLATAVNAWRQALTREDQNNEEKIAANLYHRLLADVVGLDTIDALVVVPDGPMHGLPFAALIGPNNQRLIQAHTLALAAMIPDPGHTAADASPATIDLLAMGGGELAGTHPELPGAAQELADLRQLPWRNARFLIGPKARTEALREFGPQAQFLHFALHGLNDPASPMDSAILLPGGGSRPLAAWDIFETLRLNADLVVLAACNTAPGVAAGYDGWLGLTRAFQFAGARRVISTSWSVNDAATATLMHVFYQRLATGEGPELALAKAQREMLTAGQAERAEDAVRGVGGLTPKGIGTAARQTRRPYFWAAFQVYLAPK